MSHHQPGQKRRRADVVSLETLDLRVAAIEEWREAFVHDFQRYTTELQSNTALTEEIHGDTKGLVVFATEVERLWTVAKARIAAFKRGSYATGKWLTAVCGGAYALFVLGKALGWWS